MSSLVKASLSKRQCRDKLERLPAARVPARTPASAVLSRWEHRRGPRKCSWHRRAAQHLLPKSSPQVPTGTVLATLPSLTAAITPGAPRAQCVVSVHPSAHHPSCPAGAREKPAAACAFAGSTQRWALSLPYCPLFSLFLCPLSLGTAGWPRPRSGAPVFARPQWL